MTTAKTTRPPAHPPETIEGWYSLHQTFSVDRAALRALGVGRRHELRACLAAALGELAKPEEGGWTGGVTLVGAKSDAMLIHFRPTLDSLGEAQRRLAREPLMDVLRVDDAYLGVTEAGMYHATATLAAEAQSRGGKFGDEAYGAAMQAKVERERASKHVQTRLYPAPPAEMEYVCFYPMSKRRDVGQNWYALPVEERSRMMMEHGMSGRRYAGRVFQVITGSVGFHAWEWGVTLFARDPLLFKKIVTEMRFDEASAEYAEFGDFWVGRLASPERWVRALTDIGEE